MADKKTAGKFRLREKCGTHTEPGAGGVWFVQAGQVVEGRTDLAKRFPEKFDKVDDSKKVTATFLKNTEDGQQPSLASQEVAEQIAAPVAPSEPSESDLKEAQETFKTYESMTVAELKAQAAEDEIDLGGAKSKAEILDVFRQHLGLSEED